MADFENLLAQANSRLKAARVRASIAILGDRLVLRGTFPAKPGSNNTEPSRQRIFLGTCANPAGLKYAEAEAKKVGALLDQRQFDWTPYLHEDKSEAVVPVVPQKDKTIADWITDFEQNYFTKRARNSKSESTWRSSYCYVLRKLPLEVKLSRDVLIKTVKSTPPDTRDRQMTCFVLRSFAKFAGFELDVKDLSGKYSPKTVEPKELPTDEEIYEWFFKIQNPQWQFVYGLMACYGLRNHEVFQLDYSNFPIIKVLDGKTGDRQVWPFPEKWLEPFDLANPKFPNVSGINNKSMGERVSKAFKRAQVPWNPYSLRHSYAIRTINIGLPVELASKQMGHSLIVHENTYFRSLSERQHQEAYDKIYRKDQNLPLL